MGRRRFGWAMAAVLAALVAWAVTWPASSGLATTVWLQEQTRSFNVSARRYAFTPERLEVQQGDLVRIELRAQDIPHSFTIDAYRISKRAAPGTTVSFEFRAEQAGSFRFYCNLRADEGCRDMHGTLVVHPR